MSIPRSIPGSLTLEHETLPLLPQSSRKRLTTSPLHSIKISRLRTGGFADGRLGTALNLSEVTLKCLLFQCVICIYSHSMM